MSIPSLPDLCDEFGDQLQVAEPLFRHFTPVTQFCGPISTVRCFEDNSFVASQLRSPGEGRVLVVDGAASMGCALVGDQLAAAGVENNWAGIVVNGCVRDVEILAGLQIGIMALAPMPRRSVKAQRGDVDVDVSFAGTRFVPGEFLYADTNGIAVAASALVPA